LSVTVIQAKEPSTDKERSDQFDEKESQARFEAALRGGLSTPHRPLKEKPKTKKSKKAKKKPGEWAGILKSCPHITILEVENYSLRCARRIGVPITGHQSFWMNGTRASTVGS
jgi:hypothetical protein